MSRVPWYWCGIQATSIFPLCVSRASPLNASYTYLSISVFCGIISRSYICEMDALAKQLQEATLRAEAAEGRAEAAETVANEAKGAASRNSGGKCSPAAIGGV